MFHYRDESSHDRKMDRRFVVHVEFPRVGASLDKEFRENEASILVRQPHGYVEESVPIGRDDTHNIYSASQQLTFHIKIQDLP